MIHRAASSGFSRAVDAYRRGRPGYPATAIALLAERLDLRPGRRVLDLAAGAGALTRPLLDTGAEVIAVEPVAEMRAALPSDAHALDGTAEAIPLEDRSVDAVTVAQAFHWFDAEAALAEIHRVLRPRGLLAIVWNRRVDGPVNDAIDRIIDPHRADTPTYRGDTWHAAFEGTPLFGPLESHAFANEQRLDADGLEARVVSTSFIAALPDGERARVAEAVRRLAAEGPVTVPYRTEVHFARRAG